MAGTTAVDPRTSNMTVRSLEGETKWSTTSLTYTFVTAADSAAATTEFNRFTRLPTEMLNYLDASDTSENAQRNATIEAFNAMARVSGLTFSMSADFATADIKVLGVDNFESAGESRYPGTVPRPGSTTEFDTWNFFNTTSPWTTATRETGGGDFMISTTIHEFLHSMGLGHPHDTQHGSVALPNSNEAAVSTDNPLDNERYTMMAYESGGTNVYYGLDYGHGVTPMALDIAALQGLYGANTTTHTGNTTYNLTDRGTTAYDGDGSDGTVSIGRAFYSIWDAGGDSDSINYSGSQRTVINLNPATLNPAGNADLNELIKGIKKSQVYSDLPTDFKYDYQGDANNDASAYYAGGFFSRVFTSSSNGDLGGYSIANGVVIENASGGDKGDLLVGNTANNMLEGNDGKDALFGFDGNDTLKGGADDDEMTGGDGNDRLEGGAGTDVAIFSEACRNYEITRDDATGQVTIRHKDGGADGTDILIDVETARFKDGEIDLTAEEIADCPPLDFTFLVDLSGSFGDDLPNFVASAKQIAADLRADNPDVKFAIASFIDRPVSPWGSPGDYLYQAELALTDDVAAFERTLDGLSVRSGNDFPEAQWVGLWRAANGVGLNLREGSSRIIYMATDAPAHSASDYGLDESTIRDFLENEGIETEGAPERTPPPGDAPDGYDGEGVAPELPRAEDLLIAAVGDAFSELSAIPIIGTSGSEEHYREALEGLGSEGVVVTTSRDSSDVADAVRVGLAEIGGEVTDTGDTGDDELTGTEDPDVILGLGGNDTILGLGGDDELDGGSGNDSVEGGEGNDRIDGGSGEDTLDGGAGNDTLNPGSGIDLILPGAGGDIIEGPGNSLNGDRIGAGFGQDDLVILRTESFTGDPFIDFTPGADSSDPGTSGVQLDLNGDGSREFTLLFDGDVTDGLLVGSVGEDIVIGYLGTTGSPGNDALVGTDLPDEINALGGNDSLSGLGGDDTLIGGPGDDTIFPGLGNDLILPGEGTNQIEGPGNELNGDRIGDGFGPEDAIFVRDTPLFGDPEILFTPGADSSAPGTTTVMLDTTDDGTKDFSLHFEGDLTDSGLGVIAEGDDIGIGAINFTGTPEDDNLVGNRLSNEITGLDGNDRIVGLEGNDHLIGGDGVDTLNGGPGDDTIHGFGTDADLRDVIFAGDGNDSVDGGYGNDQIFGQGGNDTIAGGFGVDELQGQDGDDVITGSAFSDLVFGGEGDDFVNGGFGHDRTNGGDGADKFFHVGVLGHGSDWIQDYDAAEGDVLLWGGAPATADDFQVNFAHTADDAGERSGDDGVIEAFVIYKPTEQIMWALVDGGGQSSINLQIGGDTFDLLA